MHDLTRRVRDFFVSLKLTVVLLACSLVLVFAATLAQVELGIYVVQERFFHSWLAIWHVGPLYIPMPGGYLVGGLLLINLIGAHLYRLKLEWRKAGIQLTHSGLIVLLVGELLTGLWQEDFSMAINEGESRNYSESFRLYEVAVVDVTDEKFDDVVAIPDSRLIRRETVQHPKLPFRVVTKSYFENSVAQPRAQVPNPPPVPSTKGPLGERYVVTEQPVTYRPDARNIPATVVELIGTEGSLGSWLLRPEVPVMRPDANGVPQLDSAIPRPDRFTHGGRTWELSLRLARAYKPFALQVIKVTHDNYVGTDLPKNFSSRIKLTTPDGRDDREVLIYMNNPLRYGGYTFFQYQMNAATGNTVFQVVRNPSWLLPYIACIMMGLGLTLQFGLSLLKFMEKRRPATAKPPAA
jgi:hypothetical protein